MLLQSQPQKRLFPQLVLLDFVDPGVAATSFMRGQLHVRFKWNMNFSCNRSTTATDKNASSQVYTAVFQSITFIYDTERLIDERFCVNDGDSIANAGAEGTTGKDSP